jgi:beta-lactamase superfamily II metal-dependent hydrolase
MIPNHDFRIHFVNVNHGDCIILEFPDYGLPNAKAHFGIVDFGAKRSADKLLPTEYMKALIAYRRDNDPNFDYEIDFACVTHPHDDHYRGLPTFMDEFSDRSNPQRSKLKAFWDCGFRTTSITYNKVLKKICNNENVTFVRLSSGTEFEFGSVRIIVLGPSIDLRNRFDTYGVSKNDASVVLRIQYQDGYSILTGDAEFASWGKITEEFPRTARITFSKEAMGLADRDETPEQLKCQLLKLSHHGSKHGSSLEYLERLSPTSVVIPAASQNWYRTNIPQWKNKFPHPLVNNILSVLNRRLNAYVTGIDGNVVYKFTGSNRPRSQSFKTRPDHQSFANALATVLNNL